MLSFYTRGIDGGHGVHTVVVNSDRVIVAQWIGPAPGQYHSYTGDGNPDWVGKPYETILGRGFRRMAPRAEAQAAEAYRNAIEHANG